MPHYRLYRFGTDGRAAPGEDIAAADDGAARDAVRERRDGGAYELWHGKRRLAVITAGGEDQAPVECQPRPISDIVTKCHNAIVRARASRARANETLERTKQTVAETRRLIDRQDKMFRRLAANLRAR